MTQLLRGIRAVTLLIIGGALVVAVAFPVTFLGDSDWAQPIVVVILAAGLLLVGRQLRYGLLRVTASQYQKLLIGLVLMIVVVQMIIAVNFVDVGRADSFFVRNQGVALALNAHRWAPYFQLYPNNVNAALLESLGIRLLRWTNPWVGLNLLRFAWLDTALVAGLYLLRHWQIWQPGAALWLLAWLVSVPVAAYGVFAYTDATVFPLILDSLALVILTRHRQGARYWGTVGGLMLLLAFGVNLKGNFLILWLAVGALALIFWGQKKLSLAQLLGWIALAVTTLLLMNGLFTIWGQQTGYQRRSQVALPATSWVAMGLNPSTAGQYHKADVLHVRQQPTATLKKQATRTMIQQRLRRLGVGGGLAHLGKKFQLFWATGDFDSFRLTSQWIRVPKWYQNDQRSLQFWLVLATQVGYVVLLMGAGISLIYDRVHSTSQALIGLTVVGLTLFHVVLWEVEPRYALPLVPGLLLLAINGWCLVPVRPYSAGQRRCARLASVLLGTLCLVNVAVNGAKQPITTRIRAVQGNGAYAFPQTATLDPQRTVSWTVTPSGTSNQLTLFPASTTGTVVIQVWHDSRCLDQVKGHLGQVTTLNYGPTAAKTLRIRVTNTGHTPVKYGAVVANYDPHTGAIRQAPQADWQYTVQQTGLNQPVVTPTACWWVGLLVVGIIWWSLLII